MDIITLRILQELYFVSYFQKTLGVKYKCFHLIYKTSIHLVWYYAFLIYMNAEATLSSRETKQKIRLIWTYKMNDVTIVHLSSNNVLHLFFFSFYFRAFDYVLMVSFNWQQSVQTTLQHRTRKNCYSKE